MKFSSCTILAILPLAIQSVIATPVAEPDFDTLEERGGGNHKDWDKEWDNGRWQGQHDKNPCEVKQTYPYYKYPCSSSPSNGTSLLGATFTSFCKYQYGDSGVWYAAPKGWVKEGDKPRRCLCDHPAGATNPCPV